MFPVIIHGICGINCRYAFLHKAVKKPGILPQGQPFFKPQLSYGFFPDQLSSYASKQSVVLGKQIRRLPLIKAEPGSLPFLPLLAAVEAILCSSILAKRHIGSLGYHLIHQCLQRIRDNRIIAVHEKNHVSPGHIQAGIPCG